MTSLPAGPSVYCPITSIINPAADWIEAESIAWIDRIGMCKNPRRRARAIGSRAAEFFSRLCPNDDPERVLLAAQWTYWGFAYDDVFCDSADEDRSCFPATASITCRAWEVPTVYRSGGDLLRRSCAALQDIAGRTRAMATPVQVQRMAQAHRAWLLGAAWHVLVQSSDQHMSLDDYLTMRIPDSGGPPTLAWLEICSGLEVPAAEMDSPEVRAATEMAIVIAALDNDRQSRNAEGAGGYTSINAYSVLTAAGHPPDEAALHITALRDDTLDRFLRLRDRVAPDASPALVAYLTGLTNTVRGNLEWGQRVPRYRHIDAPAQLRWVTQPTPPPGGQLLRPTTIEWWTQVE